MSGFAYIWNISEAELWTSGGTDAKARFEWTASDADSGDSVAAYRVRIYSDGSGVEDGPDKLYDSGAVNGNPLRHDADYGLANLTAYWWTIKVRDLSGEWSNESARTEFKVDWGQAIYSYNTGSSTTGSWSWDNAATPAGTQSAFFFASTPNSDGSGRSAWQTSIGAVPSNTYLNVMVRLATYTSATQPALTDMAFSYASGGVSTPDNWTRSPSGGTPPAWSLDFDTRRYGVKAMRCVIGSAAYHYIEPFRKAAADGILVQPNTDYVFSAFVRTLAALSSTHVVRLEVRDLATFTDLKHGLLTGDEYEDGPGATNDTAAYSEGWQRLHLHYHTGPDEKVVRPTILYTKSDGTTPTNNGDTFWIDACKWEEGTVVSAWTPGFLSPAVVMDSFGIQIAAGEGGAFGLRKADGTTASLDEIVDAAANQIVGSTFSPGLTFGGGSTGMTFTTNTATRRRIGDLVFVSVVIVLSAKGSSTGAALITGLPDTSLNHAYSVEWGYGGGMSGLTGAPAAYITTGATAITLAQWGATGVTALTDANFTNTTNLRLTAIYAAF